MDVVYTGRFVSEPHAQVPLPVARVRQRKSVKLMPEETRSLLAAALHAADQAGLPEEPSFSRGVIVATPPAFLPEPRPENPGFGPDTASEVLRQWPPLWLLGALPNMAAAHLAIQFGARGPCHTLATEDWQTAEQLARSWIRAGSVDLVVLAGRMAGGRIHAAVVQKAASSHNTEDFHA